MNVNKIVVPVAVGLLVVCATGCITPPPGQASRFYQLQPLRSETNQAAIPGDARVGVGPVQISTYLARPQLVTRVGDHEVSYNEYERWAEPLQQSVSLTLCENLARDLRTDHVYPFTSATAAGSAVTVPVRIFRLEKQGDTKVYLHATWSVIPRGVENPPPVRHLRVEKSFGGGTEQMVAAQSELLAELSRKIADDVAPVLAAANAE